MVHGGRGQILPGVHGILPGGKNVGLFFRPLFQVPGVSKFMDENAEGLNDAAFALQMTTPGWLDAPGSYHNGACGLAFADAIHPRMIISRLFSGSMRAISRSYPRGARLYR